MLKSTLKEIIKEQQEWPVEKVVVRRERLEEVESLIKGPFVIILTGIRRCGKSTLLQEIREKYPGYYLNFDDERLIQFAVDDFQHAHEIFIELYGEKDIFYFDEIQNVSGWERFVRRLHDQKKKIIITGSNASMLSRELGTHLTGRYIQTELYPFSYNEFLLFKEMTPSIKDAFSAAQKAALRKTFQEYLDDGGFPEYLKTKNDEYLRTLYENILYRDILVRYKILQEKSVKELVYFIGSNVGKQITFNSIKKMLNLGSQTTVKEYFSYLENSFLVFLVPEFSYSLKKQIYAPKKIFFIDTGLVRCVGYRSSEDRGRLLENIVFIELKRRKHKIYYHKEKYECDFVCATNKKVTMLAQVCYELKKENEERELNGLFEAMDKYKIKESLLLTFDQEEIRQVGKKMIRIMPVWKWLLK